METVITVISALVPTLAASVYYVTGHRSDDQD
ncbi:hypothetical protein A8924_0295 [Saccharopolyspora erythraea NRRL 2338]|uniref:Uncharacterized protein n=1 Tax=Saccharopolyspora erythraea (strain ATCC 11635 / DSM 40517 / JCM 4748 / NBRC 13426 / NCIMB 8594 / NRRL 2338) TaxID=405948 RepID=A4FQZ2_SACEN|nr:hypothetical protein N599_32230 [Saccharopolyspora erythraea D]PFG93069.1 hypothetical protein A8924_0295 [Saccharopolyspora erythraea NRRL 2338]CAM06467.1 hypothetical protein SACE_7309 [Saccharopolyspora erythraea NRRL 2338]